jgi:hypothetical protein
MDNNEDKPSSTDDKESKSGFKISKMSILIIVIVVAFVGVTAAFLIHMNNYAATVSNNAVISNNNSTAVNETQLEIKEPTWHNVTSFSGSRTAERTFNIKGDRFKMVMSATPYASYRSNTLKVEFNGPDGNSNVLGAGELSWGYREGVKTKEITIEVNGTPGSYTARVNSYYIKMWNITVYDYY